MVDSNFWKDMQINDKLVIDTIRRDGRDTIYFKDDDSRLSFLQGNYITLTNLSQKDLDRIIRYNLSPVNVSIHTMNPELRCKMLGNRFAGSSLQKLDILAEAGIEDPTEYAD